jgi:NAD(P)H-hydrate epimerase
MNGYDMPQFPERPADAHKGSVGRLVIIGGRFDEMGMIGAPSLAAGAAFRCGAGLVQIVTTAEAQGWIAMMAPCATTRRMNAEDARRLADFVSDFGADAVAIGCGMSPVIDGYHILAMLDAYGGPVIIDADALNALAALGSWHAPVENRVILTPHPGEMRRLAKGVGLHVDVSDKAGSAVELARATSTIVVHKGAGTVVTDGSRAYLNETGNPGMASGGMGDVLTGVILALLGQKLSPFDASVLGVNLHGLAGDIAADDTGEPSLTALDLMEALPDAIMERQDANGDYLA